MPPNDDRQRERTRDFEASYEGRPPWDIGRPQPAFDDLLAGDRLSGRVLDLGCGTGELSLALAERGADVLGIDASERAIGTAREKATARGLDVDFRVHDALSMADLPHSFDAVTDCGLFHVFADDERVRYAEGLRTVLAPGGTYAMLCFSEFEPPGPGPRRVAREEIEGTFGEGFVVERIDEVPFRLHTQDEPVRGYLTVARRSDD